MKIIEQVIDVRFNEEPFTKTLGEVLKVRPDSTLFQIASHLLKNKDDLDGFIAKYWAEKKPNDLFDALCDYKEDYLKNNVVIFETFNKMSISLGIAETCNRLFFCGLNKKESNDLNKHFLDLKITPQTVYDKLNTNIFYNPLKIVL